MARNFSRFLSAVLFVSLVFLLFSCSGREIVKDGIDISNEKIAFSKETEEKSKDVFYSILEGAHIAGGVPSIPPKKAEELRSLAEDIWKITVDYEISEAQYSKIISETEKNKESFIALFTDSNPSLDAFKSVYRSLSSGGSPDYAGHTLYNLLLFGMNYKYGKQMERYEKYGYLYLLEEAETIKEQKNLLESEIGAENFSAATRISVMGAELFFGGAFEGAAVESFSDREIVTILKRVDIESLSISSKGYKFFFSLCVGDAVDGESTFAEKILYTANKNSDLDRLAAVANDFLKLVIAAQSALVDSDARFLKNAEYSALISSVFAKFSDAEWTTFASICETELDYNSYESIFLEEYGADFADYCNSVGEAYTLSELRTSIGNDDFLEKMEGYLAGISPVLSYRIFK